MPFKFNPFTFSLDYYSTSGGGGAGVADAKKIRVEYFEAINTPTGQAVLPSGATILLNQFSQGTNAVLAKISSSKPIQENVVDAGGVILAVDFDILGNWIVSGTPSPTYPIALCYVFEVALEDYDDTDPNIISSYYYSGINASAIANGTVSNTEFQYLNSLTSNAQTQLDAKELLVNKDTDVTLAANSDTNYPSQKAVKTYSDAKVADAINNGTLTIAPSQNAVFDALALKANLSGATFSGAITATNLSGTNTGDDPLDNITETLNTTAPNATIPVVSITAINAATDVDLALTPKGNGAILAQIPDNGTGGGNKRGTNAVDFQFSRTANSMVASGANSFATGRRNTASAADSIGMGFSNVASGAQSVAVGSSNTSSGTASFSCGAGSTSGGTGSFVSGNTANTGSIYGRKTHSSGAIASTGDAQFSEWDIKAATTDATSTLLTMGGIAAQAASRVLLPNNTAFAFEGIIVGKKSGSTDCVAWKIQGLIVRGANAASTVIKGTPTITAIENAAAWGTPTIAADTTNGCLSVNVVGLAATNIRWDCTLRTTEVTYA